MKLNKNINEENKSGGAAKFIRKCVFRYEFLLSKMESHKKNCINFDTIYCGM
jgi:hypothetical protein